MYRGKQHLKFERKPRIRYTNKGTEVSRIIIEEQ